MEELEASTYHNALPLKTMLLEYRLESVLGAGGFGITYLGWDTHLEKHVAIKEYLPSQLAIRALDGSILPLNTESEYNYKWGLDRFIQEARTLAKFSHPNIVRVNRYFETNGTSYMVMDYEAGESLHQYLKRTPVPDEATVKGILMPILDGLQAVHQTKFLHRDIKPSNVFIRKNGAPVLLDFGSARLASGAVAESMTAIVSPGYAPLEQYSNNGHQGPWSDIYALAAVIYRAVTGENPPDAVKRMKSDSVPHSLTAARIRYSERFLKAIEWGMAVDERMRPQNIAEWRDLFTGRAPMTAMSHPVAGVAPGRTGATTVVAGAPRAESATTRIATRRLNEKKPAGSKTKWLVVIALGLLALTALAIVSHQRRSAEPAPAAPMQPPQSTEPAAPPPQETPSEPAPATAPQSPEPKAVAPTAPASVQQPAPSPTSQPPGVSSAPASTRDALPELPAGYKRKLEEAFRYADADASGDLSRSEVTQRLKMIAGRFDAIDANSDGKVSMEELDAAMRKDLAGKQPGEGPDAQRFQTGADTAIPPFIKKEFEMADRDGNGYLTRDEIRSKFPYIEQNFSQVDTDGDGRISPVELMQLRKKQQQGNKSGR